MFACPPMVRHTLGTGQNGRHFAEDLFKLIFLNEYCFISIRNSLKCVPMCLINDDPINDDPDNGLCRIGDEPLHDDVIKWKHFPRYLPFMRGIHQ